MLGGMKLNAHVLGPVLVVLASLFLWETTIAVKWSPDRVAAAFLEETPPGTSRADVKKFILARNGVLEPESPRRVWADVGGYWGPLGRYRVWVIWVFNEDDQVIDMGVSTRWCGL
jgi:hypothetical protein